MSFPDGASSKAAGNFRHPRRKFRSVVASASRPMFEISRYSRFEPLASAGARLALREQGTHVLRTIVLSIVFTLAAGSNATLLCAVRCHPLDASPASCQHQDPPSASTLTQSDRCTDVSAGSIAFVRGDARREVSSSGAADLVLSVSLHFGLPPDRSASGDHAARHRPLEARPLILALRI